MIKHAFNNPKADGGDATIARPSDWNADHVITGDVNLPAQLTFTVGHIFNSAGNVGIGTASPTSFGANYRSVEVAGQDTSSGGVFRSRVSDSSHVADFFTASAFGGAVLRTTTASALSLYTNGTSRMQIAATGEVTIASNLSIGGFLQASDAAGVIKDVRFQSAGVNRWIIRSDGVAEAGSNAGSNFAIMARKDDGTALFSNCITINRASGNVGINTVATAIPVGAQNALYITGGIATTGATNGFAFADRTTSSTVWTWYGDTGTARLFRTSDVLTVTAAGNLNAAGTVTGSNLSGTNTGDQTITLTGVVTGSGTGSFATSFAASPAFTTPNIGVATGTSLAVTGALTSSGGGVGYATGAGGTVAQATSKATGVTLNTFCGTITMNAAALAAAATVTFTVTNSQMGANDVVHIQHDSVGTIGSYTVMPNTSAAGSFKVSVRNNSAGSLSEAIVLRFAIIKAAVA